MQTNFYFRHTFKVKSLHIIFKPEARSMLFITIFTIAYFCHECKSGFHSWLDFPPLVCQFMCVELGLDWNLEFGIWIDRCEYFVYLPQSRHCDR